MGRVVGGARLLIALALGVTGCFGDLPEPLAPSGGDGAVVYRIVDGMVEAGPDLEVDAAPSDGMPSDGPPVDRSPPPREICNGEDDDGDLVVDESFPLGEPCEVGQGPCRAEGHWWCAPGGMDVVCDALAGSPSPDICNGIDDDCSGVVDEDFPEVGAQCEVGEGVCRATGTLRCTADGSGSTCDVEPDLARQGPEECNGQDDDCDGWVDEGLVRSCANPNDGICLAGQSLCQDGVWGPCAADVEPDTLPDVCNGLDDDCDGRIDENQLPGGHVACACEGEPMDGCIPVGCIRQCDPQDNRNTVCAAIPERDCDGRDDDCDGVVDDDGVCGPPMVATCTFGLGWSVEEIPAPSPEWGECDIEAGGFTDTHSCNGTRDDDIVTVSLPVDVDVDDVDDALGVAFRCSPGAVGDYIVSRCRVVMGLATADAGVADGAAAWGPCPEAPVGGDAQVACTSNTFDGGFNPLPVPFDLTTDGLMAVAFVCDDPDDPQRAAVLQASMAVSLAWADDRVEGEVDWQAACAPLGDGDPYTACARTRGDGLFRTLRLTADVGGGDRFAIALEAL